MIEIYRDCRGTISGLPTTPRSDGQPELTCTVTSERIDSEVFFYVDDCGLSIGTPYTPIAREIGD